MLNKTIIPFPIITSERLTIRQLTINDQQGILTLRSDIEINKYLNRKVSKTIDDARDFINTVSENIKKGNSIYWAIMLTKSKAFVGTICLFDFSDTNHKCEIGYELMPNFQRQGIMKEAAEKVIDYAFDTLHVKKIEAFPHTDNINSIKLLEKLSFQNSNEPDKKNPELKCYYLLN